MYYGEYNCYGFGVNRLGRVEWLCSFISEEVFIIFKDKKDVKLSLD